MSDVVIVYGPMGSGKTRHAIALMQHFGLTRLVEPWTNERLQPGTLALTNREPPFRVAGDTKVLSIVEALKRLQRVRE